MQQSKIVAAINALDADVVGLQEIENSVKLGEPVDEALGNLVDALNADAGSAKWAFVPTPPELQDAAITDFITSAIIYQPASVTPVGPSFALVDETVWNIAREPLAQTFQAKGTTFTVIANHFKSKSRPGGQPDRSRPTCRASSTRSASRRRTRSWASSPASRPTRPRVRTSCCSATSTRTTRRTRPR